MSSHHPTFSLYPSTSFQQSKTFGLGVTRPLDGEIDRGMGYIGREELSCVYPGLGGLF